MISTYVIPVTATTTNDPTQPMHLFLRIQKKHAGIRNNNMYGRISVSNTETPNMAISLPFVSRFRYDMASP